MSLYMVEKESGEYYSAPEILKIFENKEAAEKFCIETCIKGHKGVTYTVEEYKKDTRSEAYVYGDCTIVCEKVSSKRIKVNERHVNISDLKDTYGEV